MSDKKKKVEWKAYSLKTAIDYKWEEPNVFLLDMAQFAIDDGQFEDEEEILRIDIEIRKRLNIPLRTFSMAQPYMRAHEEPCHRVKLRYHITLPDPFISHLKH